MCKDVVFELDRCAIASELVEAFLVIDDEKYGVSLVQTFVRIRMDYKHNIIFVRDDIEEKNTRDVPPVRITHKSVVKLRNAVKGFIFVTDVRSD